MRGKVYPRLYFPAAASAALLEIVEPYIQPCFAYKIRGQQTR
jgi:hypothetical protein